MNKPATDATASHSAPARRPWFVFLLVCSGLLLLLLGLGLLFLSRPTPTHGVAWLTPGKYARAVKPGPWPWLQNLLWSASSYLWRAKASIHSQVEVWCPNPLQARQDYLLPPAISTNVDGTRAWELSSAQLERFERQLHAQPMSAGSTSLASASGRIAGVPLMRPGMVLPPAPLSWNETATYRSGAIRLLLNVNSLSSSSPPICIVACRASIVDGGALLIEKTESAKTEWAGPTTAKYWLILSAHAVDAQGNPLSRSARAR